MDVYIRPNSSKEKIQEVIEEWYRAELRKDISILIDKWEKILNVKVKDFGIKTNKNCIRKRKIYSDARRN